MIPDYQTLMRPVLSSARDGPRKISDVVDEMSDLYNLTSEERLELLPSGKQTKIANRTHWARSYMKQAGLVRNIRRGWFELTDRGRKVLEDEDTRIDSKFLEKFDEFLEFKSRDSGSDGDQILGASNASEDSSDTPEESLQLAHSRLQDALAASLLDYVRNASPAFFEQLIVDLLISMGYGGSSTDAGRALGQTGDDGVDGVIDQDALGVDQVYLQAKRYGSANSVGAPHIRDFFGALSIKKANKGIFFTTSHFTESAKRTAQDLGLRIVLIDGEELARLMMQHNVGCRDKDILHIKQIDEGYFDEDGLG